MHFACRINKARDIHSKCVILSSLHRNGGYGNTPQCYVMRTLPLIFVYLTPHSGNSLTFVTLYINGHPWMHDGAHSGIVTSTVATYV